MAYAKFLCEGSKSHVLQSASQTCTNSCLTMASCIFIMIYDHVDYVQKSNIVLDASSHHRSDLYSLLYGLNPKH